ncbi:MAG: hypothetical protein AVDCRST_MAG56-5564 [uncultured Cytophagales bacterium]|uniref:Uncharacterized protein n=1 Tax=uncultured Cytophagales bacterium TaxID=158755 RepID=A0A6J4KBW2_9SPHI|nr:MAG: hypothetical protein AVDCRST_MAG56-5564 [uncultured Cytophagales bacterium]
MKPGAPGKIPSFIKLIISSGASWFRHQGSDALNKKTATYV